MNNKLVKSISDKLKDLCIETIYLAGTSEKLAGYYPCKFIIDREVEQTSSEIIEINELILKKPVRLNGKAVVIISFENDKETENLNEIINNLKEKSVYIIALSNESSAYEGKVDDFILCNDFQIDESMPSTQLLLTCGILHQREEIVYPELFTGMDKNITLLKEIINEETTNMLDVYTRDIQSHQKISIVASGTDVASQFYLKKYLETSNKNINVESSGSVLSTINLKEQTDNAYLLFKGWDATKDLDEGALQRLKEHNAPISVVDVEDIKGLDKLDRPFAKVISSVIIYHATKMQLRNKEIGK